MNPLFLHMTKFINCVIKEPNADLPITISKDTEVITAGSFGEFSSKILEKQGENHLLVVTESPVLSQRVLAFINSVVNPYVQENYIAACCDGKWENELALSEMQRLENTLIDAKGHEYYIEQELYPGVFAVSEDGIALRDNETAEEHSLPLNKKDTGDAWGVLLTDSSFRRSRFLGTADALTDELSTRILIMADVCRLIHEHETQLPVPESMLCFSDGRVLVNTWTRTRRLDEDFTSLCFFVLFGRKPEDCRNSVIEVMLEKLISCNLPGFFINDLENVYINQASYSFEKWETIFARLKLDLHENQK